MLRVLRFLCAILIIPITLGTYILYETNRVVVVKRTFMFDNLPAEFDGFRILHVSDIHAKEFGKGQTRLLEKLKEKKIDLVALTGDYIDTQNPYKFENKTATADLINGLRRMYPDAPILFVKGNAESYDEVSLNQEMVKAGAIELDGDNEGPYQIPRGRSYIMIGLPAYKKDRIAGFYIKEDNFSATFNTFYIALTHYPWSFEVERQGYEYNLKSDYSKSDDKISKEIYIDADLFLAGHTHGGQVRLPFIGAVFIPNERLNERLFPKKYSESVYSRSKRIMNINNGLGTSGPWFVCFRFLNPPEVNIIELKKP